MDNTNWLAFVDYNIVVTINYLPTTLLEKFGFYAQFDKDYNSLYQVVKDQKTFKLNLIIMNEIFKFFEPMVLAEIVFEKRSSYYMNLFRRALGSL